MSWSSQPPTLQPIIKTGQGPISQRVVPNKVTFNLPPPQQVVSKSQLSQSQTRPVATKSVKAVPFTV